MLVHAFIQNVALVLPFLEIDDLCQGTPSRRIRDRILPQDHHRVIEAFSLLFQLCVLNAQSTVSEYAHVWNVNVTTALRTGTHVQANTSP